jgi:hypothetical protein
MNTATIYRIIFLSFSFILHSCGSKKENDESYKQIESYQLINQKYIQSSEGKNINMKVNLFDINNQNMLLKDIIKKKVTLFCRIPNLDCQPCLSLELDDVIKRIRNTEVVFLVSCENKRHFKAFAAINKHTFLINKNDLNLPIEKANKVYFFLLEKNNNIPKNYFLPVKEFSSLTLDYVKFINNQFSTN